MIKLIKRIPLMFGVLGNILVTIAVFMIMNHNLYIYEYVFISSLILVYIVITNVRIALDHKIYKQAEGKLSGIFTLIVAILLMIILIIFGLMELELIGVIAAMITNIMLFTFNYWSFK